MSRRQLTLLGVIAFAILVVLGNTFFVVDQRQEAIVVRFGEPVRVIHALGQPGAGLNAKTPFLEHVIKFDRRNLGLEADQEEVISADQERLVVDAFLRYRIADPLQYYRTLRDDRTAQARLEPLVNSALRQVLGSANSTDIISGQRAQLMAQTKADVARRAIASRFGIQVIDLRIKRADLPAANQAAVYRRMQTARQQEAAQIRAVGEQQKREIIAAADKEVAITLATAQEEVIAADQQRLVVDAFLRYRISDPLQYYRTLRDERTAQDRLERLMNSSLRQMLGQMNQSDIIAGQRDKLMQQSKQDMARRAKESRLGIEVIDFRIKRADLPAANQASVYRRMQTQRALIAAQHRAQGEQQKREIIATADKDVAITLADAQQIGETTRGEGDALRTRIFAQSFGKDPAFSAFYRSMQAYDSALGQGDSTVVLSPDSDFFRYFQHGVGGGGRR